MRKMARWQSFVVAAASVAAAVVAATAASAGGPDAVRDLGVLPGSTGGYAWSEARDINNPGQVVGVAGAPDVPHAFVWSHGTMRDLGPGEADAINDHGAVVGHTYDPETSITSSWLWTKGMRTQLWLGVASDINNAGQVVGVDESGHAVLWHRGRLSVLPVPDWATSTSAYRINERGQVIGWADNTAVVWHHGAVTVLGVLRGDDFAAAAAGINNRGEIVGTSMHDPFSTDDAAFLWRAGAMIDVSCIENAQANAINDRGQILESHAVEYDWGTGPGDFVLCEPGGSVTAVPLSYATSINDHGEVAGRILVGTEWHAALWTHGGHRHNGGTRDRWRTSR